MTTAQHMDAFGAAISRRDGTLSTSLERPDVLSHGTPGALRHLKRHTLTLIKHSRARDLYRRVVHEDVRAGAVGLDEPEALLVVEPLNRPGVYTSLRPPRKLTRLTPRVAFSVGRCGRHQSGMEISAACRAA
jgi:hypothetical protein